MNGALRLRRLLHDGGGHTSQWQGVSQCRFFGITTHRQALAQLKAGPVLFHPSEEPAISAIHANCLKDPRIHFPSDQIEAACMVTHVPEVTFIERTVGHLRRYSTFHRYMRRYMTQLVERATDTELLHTEFELPPDQFGALAYFVLLHAWLFHLKFAQLGLGVTNHLFGKNVQELFNATFSAAATDEKRFQSMHSILSTIEVEKMVYFRDLDAAFAHRYYAGVLHRLFWKYLYGERPACRASRGLYGLTIYTLRMRHFVTECLPREIFMDSEWMWPPWPPRSTAVPRLPRERRFFV